MTNAPVISVDTRRGGGLAACLAVSLAASSALLGGCAANPPSAPNGTFDAASNFDAGPRNPVADHGQLQVVGTQLEDAAGNPVQLRGVSSMWLNWESKPFAESEPALEWARDNWGLSVIRAAMGVEAQGGYLSSPAAMQTKVETIVRNAIQAGVYVIIDWHTSAATTQTTQAAAFFTAMATEFGDSPNVIYEPYNEPTGVTWPDIKPYHEAIVAAIRSVDPDNLIVLGTPNYSQDVDVAARDQVVGTNLLYTLHFYACTHQQSYRNKGNVALGLGAALFITEFGATPSDGGLVSKMDNDVCEAATNDWFSWMATNNISGTAWKLETCTDSSCILTGAAPADGPWTDDVLTSDVGDPPAPAGGVVGGGHGQFIVNWIR